MHKNNIATITSLSLVVLGIVMIYIGGFYGPKVILPPILTGVGFFIIAWYVHCHKE